MSTGRSFLPPIHTHTHTQSPSHHHHHHHQHHTHHQPLPPSTMIRSAPRTPCSFLPCGCESRLCSALAILYQQSAPRLLTRSQLLPTCSRSEHRVNTEQLNVRVLVFELRVPAEIVKIYRRARLTHALQMPDLTERTSVKRALDAMWGARACATISLHFTISYCLSFRHLSNQCSSAFDHVISSLLLPLASVSLSPSYILRTCQSPYHLSFLHASLFCLQLLLLLLSHL